LETGADPNKRGEDNITPLQIVSVYDHEEIAGLLLDHSTDVNARSASGYIPLNR